MFAPLSPLAALPARLLALQVQAALAYAQHSRDRGLVGTGWYKLWAAAYEASAAINEQNPAWAHSFLSLSLQPVVALASGVPMVPRGVLAAVDKPTAGKLTLTVDVAGAVSFSVLAPGATLPFKPAVTPAATRATAVFDAPADGVYTIELRLGSTLLTTLFVLVTRTEFRQFRELSRYQAYSFKDTLPRPQGTYSAYLARLIGAEAAARTGQPELATKLLASARALPQPQKPTAIRPRRLR